MNRLSDLLKVGTECENFRSSIETRNVIPETKTVQLMSVIRALRDRHQRTEADALPVDIDVNPQERRQAGRQEQVEAGDPATDDRALVKPLLCELPGVYAS